MYTMKHNSPELDAAVVFVAILVAVLIVARLGSALDFVVAAEKQTKSSEKLTNWRNVGQQNVYLLLLDVMLCLLR